MTESCVGASDSVECSTSTIEQQRETHWPRYWTLRGLGVEIVGSTPEQFKEFMKSENEKWAKVVKATGLTVD
jgi:hypothetical protein